MANPNIQIDDLVREMTDEEYETYLADQAKAPSPALGLTEDEIASL
jgi:hypothetical protein